MGAASDDLGCFPADGNVFELIRRPALRRKVAVAELSLCGAPPAPHIADVIENAGVVVSNCDRCDASTSVDVTCLVRELVVADHIVTAIAELRAPPAPEGTIIEAGAAMQTSHSNLGDATRTCGVRVTRIATAAVGIADATVKGTGDAGAAVTLRRRV